MWAFGLISIFVGLKRAQLKVGYITVLKILLTKTGEGGGDGTFRIKHNLPV